MTYPPLLLFLPWALTRRAIADRRNEKATRKEARRARPCRGPRTLGGFAGFRDEPEPEKA